MDRISQGVEKWQKLSNLVIGIKNETKLDQLFVNLEDFIKNRPNEYEELNYEIINIANNSAKKDGVGFSESCKDKLSVKKCKNIKKNNKCNKKQGKKKCKKTCGHCVTGKFSINIMDYPIPNVVLRFFSVSC